MKNCRRTTRILRGDQIEGMVMKILILIFLIKESKITRGHNFTLVKQSRLDVRTFFHFPKGPSMYGIHYQQSVYMLVVLMC